MSNGRTVIANGDSPLLDDPSSVRLAEYADGTVLLRTNAPNAEGNRERDDDAVAGLQLSEVDEATLEEARESLRALGIGSEAASRGVEAEPVWQPVLAYVEFAGPVVQEWLEELHRRGVEPIKFNPESSYLCRARPETFLELTELPYVSEVTLLTPPLKPGVSVPETGFEQAWIVFLPDETGAEAVAAELAALEGVNIESQPEPIDVFVRVLGSLDSSGRERLLADPRVVALEPYEPRLIEDEVADLIVAGEYDATSQPTGSYLRWLEDHDLTGAGVTIGIVDNGVDVSHPAYAARTRDLNRGRKQWHATFVAGHAAGSYLQEKDKKRFIYGIGIAPKAELLSQDNQATAAALCKETVTQTGPSGRRGSIQNNSWGQGVLNPMDYRSQEASYDRLVRNADSAAASPVPLTICFSSGNEGSAGLTRPKAAKNIIVTGNSENFRPDVGGADADSIGDVYSGSHASSYGNCGDGRIRPDLVAPGEWTASANYDSHPGELEYISPKLTWGGGSSGASPKTAGACALLVEWWRRHNCNLDPSPAMLRALLVNGAERITTGGHVPNNRQGWGRLNVGNVLREDVHHTYLDQTLLLRQRGEKREWRLHVSDPRKPVKITLAWTDPAGNIGSGTPAVSSVVNKLVLRATVRGKGYRGNRFKNSFSVDDTATVAGEQKAGWDNLQNMFLAAGTVTDTFTVSVEALEITTDCLTGAARNPQQDFALVISNGFLDRGFTPADVFLLVDENAREAPPADADAYWTTDSADADTSSAGADLWDAGTDADPAGGGSSSPPDTADGTDSSASTDDLTADDVDLITDTDDDEEWEDTSTDADDVDSAADIDDDSLSDAGDDDVELVTDLPGDDEGAGFEDNAEEPTDTAPNRDSDDEVVDAVDEDDTDVAWVADDAATSDHIGEEGTRGETPTVDPEVDRAMRDGIGLLTAAGAVIRTAADIGGGSSEASRATSSHGATADFGSTLDALTAQWRNERATGADDGQRRRVAVLVVGAGTRVRKRDVDTLRWLSFVGDVYLVSDDADVLCFLAQRVHRRTGIHCRFCGSAPLPRVIWETIAEARGAQRLEVTRTSDRPPTIAFDVVARDTKLSLVATYESEGDAVPTVRLKPPAGRAITLGDGRSRRGFTVTSQSRAIQIEIDRRGNAWAGRWTAALDSVSSATLDVFACTELQMLVLERELRDGEAARANDKLLEASGAEGVTFRSMTVMPNVVSSADEREETVRPVHARSGLSRLDREATAVAEESERAVSEAESLGAVVRLPDSLEGAILVHAPVLVHGTDSHGNPFTRWIDRDVIEVEPRSSVRRRLRATFARQPSLVSAHVIEPIYEPVRHDVIELLVETDRRRSFRVGRRALRRRLRDLDTRDRLRGRDLSLGIIGRELFAVIDTGNGALPALDGGGIDEPLPELPEVEAGSGSEYPYASRYVQAKYFRAYPWTRGIRQIVIHITDSSGTINGVIRWFANPYDPVKKKDVKVSAHYVVGRDGEVVQMVKENDIAFHANNANTYSIGIEHVANTKGMNPTAIQYAASAALVRWLCEKYRLSLTREVILGHCEADTLTTHSQCPNAVWNWPYYMELVTEAMSLPEAPLRGAVR